MNTKHTPGPWGHGNSDKPVSLMAVCFGDGAGGGTIVRFPTTGEISFNETMANARLIAAAPELLESLKVAMRVIDSFAPSYADRIFADEARAAIAKATGATP